MSQNQTFMCPGCGRSMTMLGIENGEAVYQCECGVSARHVADGVDGGARSDFLRRRDIEILERVGGIAEGLAAELVVLDRAHTGDLRYAGAKVRGMLEQVSRLCRDIER